MLADVARKRKEKDIDLNHPEAAAVVAATAMDGARASKTIVSDPSQARQTIIEQSSSDGHRRHQQWGALCIR